MAGNYNKITLVGNLTRDPESRDAAGKNVTKFALAINRKTKGGDETMFVDIVAWEKLGEICQSYLKKGMSALVEGRLSIRKYDDKDGNKRTAVEVVATDMQMLDKKGASNGNSNGSSAGADEESLEGSDDLIPF